MSAKSESVEDVYERGCLVLRTAMGGWLRSETKVCMHAFVSLGAVLSEIIASMDAFVSPRLQGDGLDDCARQGVFPARESCGKCTRVLDCIRREMVNGAVDVLDAS